VLRNGRHLLGLINSVLDLAKIEAGRMSLELAGTDLREAVTDAVSDTASLRSAKRQVCTLHLDDASLAVVADGVRVRQILFNLLSNASKFTAEGGDITLSALRARAPLRVPSDRPGDERRAVTREVVWVSVADSGIGIAPGEPNRFRAAGRASGSCCRPKVPSGARRRRPIERAEALNGAALPPTFRQMRSRRLLRLLLLALPVLLGLAAGTGHHPAAGADGVATISIPRQSLPTPVHNEATCAFCQAAIFPPCAPHPADVSITASALVREVRVAAGDRLPHFTSHRPASSRAPPSLRIV
jgi:hypothetical protein